MSAVRDLHRQTEAAKRLLESLHEFGAADDAELAADMIEGETKFHEALEKALGEIDECDAVASGLAAKEAAFASRRAVFEKRAEMLRACIERAMLDAESPKITLTTATVYLSKRAPGLIVEAEAEIPSRFWVQPPAPDPKLDKSAVKAALKAGEEVPGARLDNGSMTLNVRR